VFCALSASNTFHIPHTFHLLPPRSPYLPGVAGMASTRLLNSHLGTYLGKYGNSSPFIRGLAPQRYPTKTPHRAEWRSWRAFWFVERLGEHGMLGEWPALVEKWLTRQIPKKFLTVCVRNSLNLEIVVSSNSLGGTNNFSFFPFQA